MNKINKIGEEQICPKKMNNASRNWENTIYLINILELSICAIKFLEKLVTLLLIPLPGSLVVWEEKTQ